MLLSTIRRLSVTAMFVLFLLMASFSSIASGTVLAQTRATYCTLCPLPRGSLHVASNAIPQAPTGTLSIVAVSTTDLNNTYTNKFIPGAGIRYQVEVSNSSGQTLTGQFTFLAYWGTARVDQTADQNTIENFTSPWVSVPAGTTWWYNQNTVPNRATPGQFTYQAVVKDAANSQNYATKSTSFWVSGWQFVHNVSGNIPAYYSQWWSTDGMSQYDSGPASVAMARAAYNAFPSSTSPAQRINDVRAFITNVFGEQNQEPEEDALRYAIIDQIEGYSGVPYQYVNHNAYTPYSDEADLASLVAQNYPTVTLVNGKALGRSYTWHWVLVIGFYSSATSTWVIVDDPDSNYTGQTNYTYITLGAFTNAIATAPYASDSNVDDLSVQ